MLKNSSREPMSIIFSELKFIARKIQPKKEKPETIAASGLFYTKW